MDKAELTWNGDKVKGDIYFATRKATKALADDLLGNVVENLTRKEHAPGTRTPAKAYTESAAMISGALAASFHEVMSDNGLNFEVRSNSAYAWIQEKGGYVGATNGVLLTPVGEKGRQFTDRAHLVGFNGALREMGLKPTKHGYAANTQKEANYPGGQLVLAIKTHYIPPRPYFFPAVERTRKDAPAIVDKAFAGVIK